MSIAKVEPLTTARALRGPFDYRLPERLVEPVTALEAGAPPELIRLGLWVAREYCSTPARGLELVLPPGTASAGRRVRPKLELRAGITAEGRDALDQGARLGSRQLAVLQALVACGDDGLTSVELAAACGADRSTLRRLEGRGL